MKEFEGKKVLVLAGQDVHRKLVETAQSMGIYTIVADYLENSPCKKIADESSMISILDVNAIVKYCKENNVDAVLNFCNDPAARIVQRVNSELGHYNIGTWEQVCTFTDKELFKKACVRNGVDIVPTYSLDDLETGKIVYPVIVKPSDSRGSRGSVVCQNENELRGAIEIAKGASDSQHVIIEKYMGGCQEVEITYLVIEETPYLISFADRYTGKYEDGTDKISSCMIEPSWFIDKYLEKVDPKVKRMLQNEGIRNTAIIMQGFIDGEIVRMFDPGMRFQGNEFERVLLRACGINAMESIITYALTGKMEAFGGKYIGCYDLNGKCAVQYMVNGGPGTISKYVGTEEVKKYPGFVYLGYKYDIGEKVERTRDTKQRLFDISFLVDRSRDSIIDSIDFVNNHLCVLDENGEDMIVSKFDYRKVYPHIL
mgnify:CR=1 FL=1